MATYAWTGAASFAAVGLHAVAGDAVDLARETRRWARGLERIWSLELSVEGLEHYERGASTVLVANHQSYVDVVALLLVTPEMPVFLAKRELERVPFFGRAMKSRGDVFIDRARHDAATSTIERAARSIRPGAPLLVFPEGTRADAPRIGRFKKGAFHLAQLAHASLQPVGIRGSLEAWPRGSAVPRGGPVHVAFGPRIPADEVQAIPLDPLIARVRAEVSRLSGLPLGEEERGSPRASA